MTERKSGPSTDVIREAIRPYAIADKLRQLRLRKSMGLTQLAAHTGLSPAMLSKLENGRLVPTLPTLIRIATVFDVGLEHFFTNEQKLHPVALVRKGERMRFPERPNQDDVAYHFESLDFPAKERKIHTFLAEFHNVPESSLRPHSHAGVEVVYVLGGTLELKIGTEIYRLQEGDAVYFDSVPKHTYRRASQQRCSAIVITTGT